MSGPLCGSSGTGRPRPAHATGRSGLVAPPGSGLNVLVPNLDDVDLSLKLPKGEEAERIEAAQKRLLQLRLVNGGLVGDGQLGPPVCVVFEGWDASGKGGAIKRLVGHLDPRHVRVASFAAPTYDEKRHHFLWRFFPQLPGWGGMAVFDRSWYGRVLVERVEGFATEEQWSRAYAEICQFEHSLAQEGMVVVKLWLHISHQEQLHRFQRREANPLKSWKLGPEDWRNREKRPQYESAVQDMLARTEHPLGPWDLLSAEDKRWARVQVLETVNQRIEDGMRRVGIEVPPPLARGRGSNPEN
jgi:polyphosphate kinase 2 (PPK2 family)